MKRNEGGKQSDINHILQEFGYGVPNSLWNLDAMKGMKGSRPNIQKLRKSVNRKDRKHGCFYLKLDHFKFSLWRMMGALDTRGTELRSAMKRLSLASERASSWLWLEREDKN